MVRVEVMYIGGSDRGRIDVSYGVGISKIQSVVQFLWPFKVTDFLYWSLCYYHFWPYTINIIYGCDTYWNAEYKYGTLVLISLIVFEIFNSEICIENELFRFQCKFQN